MSPKERHGGDCDGIAEFGRLQASFKLSGNRIKGFVTVADKEQVANCQTRMDEFEKDLEERGFTMDGNSLIAGGGILFLLEIEQRVQRIRICTGLPKHLLLR